MQEQRKNKLCHGKTPRGILPVKLHQVHKINCEKSIRHS